MEGGDEGNGNGNGIEYSKDLQQQSKAVDKLTNHVEDHGQLDSTRVQELDKKVAERTLREHKGDAVTAIRPLLHVRNL